MSGERINLTNQFLIAMPGMADDTFAGTVVYLCEHNERGALGLVINRPIDIDLATLFDKIDLKLEIQPVAHQPVYFGGPVQTERGFVLHEPMSAGTPGFASTLSVPAGLAMTKALSKEVAKDGINVNTVCIGVVRSGQIGRSAATRFPGMPLEDAFKEMGKGVPVGRIGTPEEAGDLITFLASGRGGFINGASINFDGGVAPVV